MRLHLLSSLLFGLSANTDNLAVGLAYGIRKMPVRWPENLIVALVSLAGTVLSMILGKSVLLILPPKAAGILGGMLIALIGAVALLRFLVMLKKPKAEIENEEELELQTMTVKEALLLGLALTLNNVGLGVGASITGLPIIPAAAASFLFSLLFLYVGNKIGRSKLSTAVGGIAEPFAALLMIVLGIYEIFI